MKRISYLILSIMCLLVCNKFISFDTAKAEQPISQIHYDKAYINNNLNNCYINQNKTEEPKIIFTLQGKQINLIVPDLSKLSLIRKKIYNSSFCNKVKVMNFAYNNGLSKEQSVCYAFYQIEQTINHIELGFNKQAQDACVEVLENSAKLNIKESKMGVKINKNVLFDEIFKEFNKLNNFYDFKIKTEVIVPKRDKNSFINQTFLRSTYKTFYGNSNEERKNNINVATKSLDGIVLMPNEILSFNQTTGLRTQENGYKKAKIIKDGTFYQEFGGGVCQVSTTLYNAAILADLEIVEVNSHSLPVGYVEPCFDAMVNSGSSDLKIKNNTQYPIYIATCFDNQFCKINIFGGENPYKIAKKSKKIGEIAEIIKEETSDYQRFGLAEPLSFGQQKIISKGKPGFQAQGQLEYYIDDILVKTKNTRKVTYYPTKEVVLVSPFDN